jgi:capsular exopolysaccharide synthesis family protein
MKEVISDLNGKAKRDTSPPPIAKAGNEDPIYSNQIKALGAKFEYKIDILKIKVVAVTSAIAGEGKTTSCVQLARQLVMAGRKRVLLIDADMRKSDLAKGLNIKRHPGLSEFLAGKASLNDILQNSFLPGLHVIPAGRRVEDGADLLAGEKFRAFLREVRSHFDVILLDSPPILAVADTLSLRDQVDGFLFLYKAGLTPHPMLRQALEELGEEKIIGVVLNGVKPQPQSYYQRYYGSYYQKTSMRKTTE